MSNKKVNLLGYSLKSLEDFFNSIEEPKFRAKQLIKWIHQKGVLDFDEMSDLNKNLREKLKSIALIKPPQIEEVHKSSEGTIKYLIKLESGSMVEMVRIPEKKRITLCISSQAGCALQCTFCATGAQGFERNLSADEIIGQLWLANFSDKKNSPITNVVFMGMGEPLLNFIPVIESAKLMKEQLAYGLSRKRITISTSGITPQIDQLCNEVDVSLAISLHAPTDQLRDEIVPINKKYPISELINSCKKYLMDIILTAFGYGTIAKIDLVYPKNKNITRDWIDQTLDQWFSFEIKNAYLNKELLELNTIEKLFEKMGQEKEEEEESLLPSFSSPFPFKKYPCSNNKITKSKTNIIDILCDKSLERDLKVEQINISLNAVFPRLEGDKVTFIGSTFTKYGEQEPYFHHCIALNTCTPLSSENTRIESYASEKEVLIAWRNLIQKEDPDIIIGYNIFGFDYEFMFRRAEENNCIEEFLRLSRNKDEICAIKNKDTGKYQLEESTIQIASGQHDLKYIKMNGRLQIDLYNFFRREENLSSYKLDYVAGYFIGDFIKKLEYSENKDSTTLYSSNLTGLLSGSFIHVEEIGHSVDYYDNGAKYLVTNVNKKEGIFTINKVIYPDFQNKKVRWCLAKDDVTPKDIFRMTNGTADDRSTIAKYCIQDCNLVHYLFNKADILTGFIEMSKICSVPISFLVFRGQGIKLTSYIAKKCREKRTLMPVIEKGGLEEGYEGAIVLDPKCDLYLDNPVACVDYASLYPSSMISENLSHDSKVWTKEYDLA
ncbi:MAG: 23S rRNA (adenine(2503)-C(2))-methyltransferase RlmN, partial [Proteobacteria bacterium]|nr:23S rRNA (adenine(2503)-C(2))-methyltransferase RlmN [Pseudomonadota bacterium]